MRKMWTCLSSIVFAAVLCGWAFADWPEITKGLITVSSPTSKGGYTGSEVLDGNVDSF